MPADSCGSVRDAAGCGAVLPPIAEIESHGQTTGQHEDGDGADIDPKGRDIEPCGCVDEELDVGARHVRAAEALAYEPMPVCAGAVSPAIPVAEAEPRADCERVDGEIRGARRAPGPAQDDKEDQEGMEDEEADVEQCVDGKASFPVPVV